MSPRGQRPKCSTLSKSDHPLASRNGSLAESRVCMKGHTIQTRWDELMSCRVRWYWISCVCMGFSMESSRFCQIRLGDMERWYSTSSSSSSVAGSVLTSSTVYAWHCLPTFIPLVFSRTWRVFVAERSVLMYSRVASVTQPSCFRRSPHMKSTRMSALLVGNVETCRHTQWRRRFS